MLKRHSLDLTALPFGVLDVLSLDFTAFGRFISTIAIRLRTIGQPMRRLLSCGLFALLTLVLLAESPHAQDLEPRSYTNTPVGLNFLLAGYGYSEGKISFDPSLSETNGQFRTNTELLAYSRALDVFGMSANRTRSGKWRGYRA